uniref:DNA-directed RNA polymerase n=1 Tax=Physcomitrium patens TaxID=3218 RepID=A0A2K1KXC7_PHYPA|nr:hypothetical protein PHYPA_005438 [Physcomitrium patens]
MEECKHIGIPLEANLKLMKLTDEEFDEVKGQIQGIPYKAVVCSLMYAMVGTRMELAYAVSVMSQHISKAGPIYSVTIKRIMKYLKDTLNFKLCLGCDNITLHGYYNADWVGDANDKRSTMGYMFFVGMGVISWNSKRQPTIARSTMEAKYMVASHSAMEAIWLRQLLEDIGDVQMEATLMECDNQGCLAFVKNSKYHSRIKHIDIQHHCIRKKIEMGVIDMKYCAMEDMLVDLLTKKLNENERQAFIARHSQAQVCPEKDVDSIASQSIGQPTTQIALSSFHSAGTTAVEVLEGIPRLKSILNCSFKQSTSIVRITKHTSPSDFVYLTIPDVMSSYYIEHDLESWWYAVAEKHNFYTAPTSYNEDVVFRMIVDSKKMKAYKISLKLIRDRIVESMYENNIIRVLISPEFEHTIDIVVQRAEKSRDVEMYVYGLVKSIIFSIQICGIKDIEHVLINNNEVKTNGSNLMSTLRLDFVDTKLTISDLAIDVLNCLRIKATRNVLVRELSKVLKGDVHFDDKHINLLADFMTNKGKMVHVNIFGMVERGHSYLTRASNERTIVELARVACKGVGEPVQSIFDSIIIGSRAKVGTCIIDILHHT